MNKARGDHDVPKAVTPRLLSLIEAATLLGVSTASMRRLVSAGKLPVVRLTRRLLVDARDLERLIDQAKDRSGW